MECMVIIREISYIEVSPFILTKVHLYYDTQLSNLELSKELKLLIVIVF